MLKFEWPLIVPENEDVKRLAAATYDIGEYVVDISKKHGLPGGMKPLPEGVSVHMACHARAQNMGAKAAEIAAPHSRHAGRCDRALRGPWRHVRRSEGDARRRDEGGAPGDASGREPGARPSRVGLSAGGQASPSGGARHRGEGRKRRSPIKEAEHPIEIIARAYGLI